MTDSLTLGRAKRATAGNRMRELLEKAHQQDDDDLFKEEEGDEEFAAPVEIRDVYLDEFADTDDEVEDEEAEERELRREEKRKSKGKGKAAYNPLAGEPKPKKKKKHLTLSTGPSASTSTSIHKGLDLLDPSIDPSTMAPSTLVLTLRKKRRDLKRLERSETRRSNLRASTLKTDAEIEEREKAEKMVVHRKGRVAMHKGGEARGVRNFTQAELIAEALEEEERNKEELQKWLRREEERRELRRVGRKRVRGPRWTWISRTVGKMVEIVEDGVKEVEVSQARPEGASGGEGSGAAASSSVTVPPAESANSLHTKPTPDTESQHIADTSTITPGPQVPANDLQAPAQSSTNPSPTEPAQPIASSSKHPIDPAPPPTTTLQSASTPVQPEPSQYTRNYLILSKIPGGLPAELGLVLGNHVEWDQVQYIPARNRPVIRRRPRCPFTGKIAKYRHPSSMIPYADVNGYRHIEDLLRNRYIWSEGGFWVGGEEDIGAKGVEELEVWEEATHGGWMGGFALPIPELEPEAEVVEIVEQGVVESVKRGKKRASEAGPVSGPKGKKRGRKSVL